MSTLLSAKIQFSFAPFSRKSGGGAPSAGKKPDKIPGKGPEGSPRDAKKLPCRSKGAPGADEGT